ncbi:MULTISPECIES: SDR family NAD(P)-dependent oxidoreductase [Paenibacillaceae]|jgi:NAD(P)-dependent dehydrogenase (short-subunit alcohol dehydrogenase family)|uniref:SDR family NAD(P)-dependent oxidoreductase n=1 Tax=Paenibacillaceae TaxID=186822 RepID=UPI001ADC9862|nr:MULTISPECIES: SDR family NAD(P)-dependent oxidoreductase [Paenibacillaceae]QTH40843.1 SDR family oxidoreductase [Cohnella sp. LGH]
MKGKVAIVTGAAGGIGRGIVEVLLREGCRVAMLDWNEDAGQAAMSELTATGGEVLFIRTDVAKEEELQAAVEQTVSQFGDVHILVNNVGTHYYRPVEQIHSEELDRVLRTDLKGQFLLIQQVLPHMKRNQSGSIINIASVHAHVTLPGFSSYAAIKGGVTAMSRSLALELAPFGIRINAVLPGLTRNIAMDRYLSTIPVDNRKTREAELTRNIPLGRMAEPDEIGELVAFLASDKASYMTGSSLVIDGGVSIRLHNDY